MKHILIKLAFILFILISIRSIAQQNHFYTEQVDTIFENLNKNYITTGILYDRAFPLSRFDFFNPFTDTANFEFSTQAYYELYQAHYNRSNLLDPNLLMDMVEYENMHNRIPIFILDYNYNKLDTMAIDDNLITLQNGFLYDVPGRPRSPYWDQRLQLATPLADGIKNTTVLFFIAPIFISRNTGLNIQSVTIDAGNGIHTLNGPQDSVNITFGTPGIKVVYIQVTFSNGTSFNTKSYVDIGINNSLRPDAASDPCFKKFITADISYKGYDESSAYKGQFVVNYYYRSNDGTACDQTEKQIKKPIILIDGFDPTDKRNAKALYEQFLFYMDDINFPNAPKKILIVQELQALGYDVILVDIPTYFITNSGQYIPLPPNANPPLPWDPLFGAWFLGKVIRGGGDYVQRNAFTLVKLIKLLNAELALQGSNEQLVIIGPSMGGQISRYALRWMELNNENHNCRLWVSFDSNHEGSILPIGLQYFIDFLAGGDISAAKKSRDRQINSPASKQF